MQFLERNNISARFYGCKVSCMPSPARAGLHTQYKILTSRRLRLDVLITTSSKHTPHPAPIRIYTIPRCASRPHRSWRLGPVHVNDLQAMLHIRLLMVWKKSNFFLSNSLGRKGITLIGAIKRLYLALKA